MSAPKHGGAPDFAPVTARHGAQAETPTATPRREPTARSGALGAAKAARRPYLVRRARRAQAERPSQRTRT